MDNLVTKTYIIKVYNDSTTSSHSVTEEIDDNNLKIENDGKMQKFRLIERKYEEKNGELNLCSVMNKSKWIYFGKRLSLEDIERTFGRNSWYASAMKYYARDMCYTQGGYFMIMEEGSMTYEEFAEKIKDKMYVSNSQKHL